MENTFCQICSQSFATEILKDGNCPQCIELKNRPHAKRPVFKAEDLDYTGRRSFPWMMSVIFSAILIIFLIYWPHEKSFDFTGVEVLELESLLENLSDDERDHVEFIKKIIRRLVVATQVIQSWQFD